MCKHKNRIICILIFAFLSISTLVAEIFTNDDYGYLIDFPEGFTIVNSDGEESYFFAHQEFPISAVFRVYETGRYADAQTTSVESLKKLGATSDTNAFQWRNETCALSYYTMILDEIDYEGWSFSSPLPSGKGILFFMMYTPKESYQMYNACILSALDSVCIDRGSYFESGPVTSYAYPSEGKKIVELSIDNQKIPVSIDFIDKEAGEFVVEREFSVLTLYGGTELQERARERYYQQIYKDSYGRLKKSSFELYSKLYGPAEKANPASPQIYIAKALLTWVQNFSYERNFSKSDFTHPVSALEGEGSDCDSRSMLLTIMLRQMNMKTAFFISTTYSHSVFGVDLPGNGARLPYNNTDFLLGETTAKIELGLIAQDMSDSSQWFAIPLVE